MLDNNEENKSCPCPLLDIPCQSRCSCVNKFSSNGCWYCCKYGSLEQRKINAIRIANKLKIKSIAESKIAVARKLTLEIYALQGLDPIMNKATGEPWPGATCSRRRASWAAPTGSAAGS